MKLFNFLLLLIIMFPSFLFQQTMKGNKESSNKLLLVKFDGINQSTNNTNKLNCTNEANGNSKIVFIPAYVGNVEDETMTQDFQRALVRLNKNSSDDTVKIWDGKKLEGCRFILRDKYASTENLYKIGNGFMNFSTKQVGYFYTKKSYSDFKLHAEWSWHKGQENANSGILLFIQKPDTVWPECIQVNYKENHAGDLIGMNGAQSNETIGKPNSIELKHLPSSEKPTGQWNKCDVIARGDSLEVYINGILQNKATNLNFTKGKIGFQLEGKPVMFRNIYLIKY